MIKKLAKTQHLKARNESHKNDILRHFYEGDWQLICNKFNELPSELFGKEEIFIAMFAALQCGRIDDFRSWLQDGIKLGASSSEMIAVILACSYNNIGVASAASGYLERSVLQLSESVRIFDESIYGISSHINQKLRVSSQLKKCNRFVQARRFNRVKDELERNISSFRTIHHFACTGGTLISKCIASMLQTVVVSEIHPFNSGIVHFNPIDPLQILIASGQVPLSHADQEQLFFERVEGVLDVCDQKGYTCVLRDHAHSDYCLGDRNEISHRSLSRVLSSRGNVLSVITVRDPIDSYASLCEHDWHKGVGGFDEYCYRYLVFLKDYSDVPILKYEEFCKEPEVVMRKICVYLDLKYNPIFLKTFNKVRLTGDSGRGRSLQTISYLKQRIVPDALLKESRQSYSYKMLKDCMGYE